MGIPLNSILNYIEDSNITVEIVGDKKVIFDEKEMSLTKATQSIKNLDYAVQPTKHWFYNGKNLRDIWEETYLEDNE